MSQQHLGKIFTVIIFLGITFSAKPMDRNNVDKTIFPTDTTFLGNELGLPYGKDVNPIYDPKEDSDEIRFDGENTKTCDIF